MIQRKAYDGHSWCNQMLRLNDKFPLIVVFTHVAGRHASHRTVKDSQPFHIQGDRPP
jgi:hypothetical protein